MDLKVLLRRRAASSVASLMSSKLTILANYGIVNIGRDLGRARSNKISSAPASSFDIWRIRRLLLRLVPRRNQGDEKTKRRISIEKRFPKIPYPTEAK